VGQHAVEVICAIADNKPVENVAEFRYLVRVITNKNYVNDKKFGAEYLVLQKQNVSIEI
jgi:hypothetical protein